ncbi:MAG: aminotransferase class IV, partial [Phycisphaerae bacterium]|nr:aminotransferase class IV [Phycisphaerae bacterium]
MEIAMVGDTIVPLNEAMVSGNERSCYFGDGVYEAIRCCNGRLFALDRHMARLKNSLQQMDMLEKVDMEQVQHRIDRALAEAGLPDSMLYFHITRGCALRSHDYINDWKPGFYLTVRAFSPQEKRTCKVITHPDWRWKRCD